MRAKGVWIAFGIGIAAGAIVAYLYAPDLASNTRKLLGQGIDDGANYLQDAADYLKQQSENLSKQAQAAIERAKSQVHDAVDVAAGKASGAAKSLHSLM